MNLPIDIDLPWW